MRPLMTQQLAEIFDNTDAGPVSEALELIQRLQEENEALRQQVDRLSGFRQLAYRDDLTGLYNRRHFEERLTEELSRAKRYGDDTTLILIDLDDFKLINDTAGHSAGDAVLALVGQLMRETCRDCDIPCRLGGDEFAFLLPSTGRAGAVRLMDRIQARIEACSDELDLPAGLTVKLSFGIAEGYLADAPHDLVDCADKSMYAHKRMRKSAA